MPSACPAEIESSQTLRQQPIYFFLREPGLQPRFVIERRFQARRGVLFYQSGVVHKRVQLLLRAQPAKPLVANRHMADFVAQNNFQYRLQSKRMR